MTERINIHLTYISHLLHVSGRERNPHFLLTQVCGHVCVFSYNSLVLSCVNFGRVTLTTGLSHPKQSIMLAFKSSALTMGGTEPLSDLLMKTSVRIEGGRSNGGTSGRREREGCETV